MRALVSTIAALCLALLAAGPAAAATLFGATSFHVFGDSLSDSGRVHALTFGYVPRSPPYWKGRFSDGPVWAEHVEDRFRAAGLARSNQAYGAAKAVRDYDGIPDLQAQARAFRGLPSRRKGAAPMAAILIGANDVMEAATGGGAAAAGRRAADQAAATARYLGRSGVERFVFVNLPDLGRTPVYDGRETRSERATRGALAYNARLDRRILELRDGGRDVRLFDLFGVFESMFDDPSAFGISDLTRPCLRGGRRCSDAEAAQKAFFDDRHPTRVVHARFAELLLDDLARPSTRTLLASAVPAAVPGLVPSAGAGPAPVPLPAPAALLLASLAGLVVVGRRRARAGRAAA